eukprot:CAMPEP_0194048678 /NCGR_PEP_ID=MMETSP0009_2-20130614/28090_1 /TAXON_ID=210454 /ORGANISM="Grammatophora oceanica, Strain CCMP 410" /LENGTH=352 /DNA_ID=CAMNT_0038694611 /DNA_START=125 /DNA_END=1183 /DNA_ORIENTATION=+
MRFQTSLVLVAAIISPTAGFRPLPLSPHLTRRPTTQLGAIGVLARKAKEADIRKYCESGVPDDVMEHYKVIQEALAESPKYIKPEDGPGNLQQTLTRRRGTITLIAEYKRRIENGGYIDDIFDPEVLSPQFREVGVGGIAVMADYRMGGCTYDDLKKFVEEQRRHRMEVPGSVMVINNDLIVDEVQVAQSAAAGVAGLVIDFSVVGHDLCDKLMRATQAAGLEPIVAVETPQQAQAAVQLGAPMISVVGIDAVDDKVSCIADVPDHVLTIANILAKDNKQLEEVEEAWKCRDNGFNCIWVSDALYKSGNDPSETPGAIIKAMLAKSSVKWASPKARSGRGEGAREYLGDIMM